MTLIQAGVSVASSASAYAFRWVLVVKSIYPSDDWLDTETRAILCKSPPALQTAVDTEGYSLLLVKAGRDEDRAIQTVSEIQRYGAKNSTNISIVIAQ